MLEVLLENIFYYNVYECVLPFTRGYFFIETGFQTTFTREGNAAQEINNLIYYSLQNEFNEQLRFEKKYTSVDTNMLVKQFASSISNTDSKLDFCIINSEFVPIFSSFKFKLKSTNYNLISQENILYSTEDYDGNTYIRIIRPVVFWDDQFYLQTIRDVSTIFENKKEQYIIFIKIMLVLLFFGGIISAFISSFLTRPINSPQL